MQAPIIDWFTSGLGRRVAYLNGLHLGEVYKDTHKDHYHYWCLGALNDRRYMSQWEAEYALEEQVISWWSGIRTYDHDKDKAAKLVEARKHLQYDAEKVAAGIKQAEVEEGLAELIRLCQNPDNLKTLTAADLEKIDKEVQDFREYLKKATAVTPEQMQGRYNI